MRYVLLLVLLAGCSDAPTRDELSTANKSILALGDEVRALRASLGAKDHNAADPETLARLDALEAKVATMQAQVMMVTAPVKVPHLIAVGTGEDLGVSLGGNCALNDKAGGDLCFDQFAPLSYPAPDCTGQPFTTVVRRRSSVRFLGFNGDVYRAEAHTVDADLYSDSENGKCTNRTMTVTAPVYFLSVVTHFPHFEINDLTIELR